MADYKQLLGKAIEALPENNGAARRQVYEKARNALVAQLRGIDPPLPSREITQHRLQLEDCIRQVEQAATDALLGNAQPSQPEAAPEPAPVAAPDPAPTPEPASEPEPVPEAKPEPVVAEETKPASSEPQSPPQVEEIPEPAPEPVKPSAAAALRSATPDVTAKDAAVSEPVAADAPAASEPKVDAPVAEDDTKEAFAKSKGLADDLMKEASGPARATPATVPEKKDVAVEAPAPETKSVQAQSGDNPDAIKELIDEASAEDNGIEDAVDTEASVKTDESFPAFPTQPLEDSKDAAAPVVSEPEKPAESQVEAPPVNKYDPVSHVAPPPPPPPPPPGAAVPQGMTAMSHEREVEVDGASFSPAVDNEAQGAIDRAIQTLDREARGEPSPNAPIGDEDAGLIMARAEELRQDRETNERGGGGAVTIFLVVLALLLAGAGGAGYWAWQEGYVDVDALFGGQETQEQVAQTQEQAAPQNSEGPGNTTATPDAVAPVDPTPSETEARLPRVVGSDAGNNQAPIAAPNANSGDNKSEERLTSDNSFGGSNGAEGATTNGDNSAGAGVVGTGAQSLLLEASTEGTTGAVPYSGSVEWSRGTDELGQPTLLAKANIPARSLSVDLLIRRNADLTLPASHLMEVDFTVSDGFIGGAIASLPGILLKNEELVRGTPLFGASARVVGNSFLFALSAADQDRDNNLALLGSRKWMDLALIYATSTRAIVTLEKDDAAQALFDEVLAIWAEADAAAAPPANEGVTPSN